jgi:hypothetical protein
LFGNFCFGSSKFVLFEKKLFIQIPTVKHCPVVLAILVSFGSFKNFSIFSYDGHHGWSLDQSDTFKMDTIYNIFLPSLVHI